MVCLPYKNNFNEKDILINAHPIQKNKDMIYYCKKEIQGLLEKYLIRKSKCSWSCSIFYVNNNSEKKKRGPKISDKL